MYSERIEVRILTWKDTIRENIRFGLIEILILALLSKEEMYGQQIKNELARRTNGAYVVEEGSLYGPLYRMESRGLIASRKEIVGARRFRNYYHIEPHGKEYLEYALNEYIFVTDGINNLLGEYKSDDVNQ